jgi:hypothetical protein
MEVTSEKRRIIKQHDPCNEDLKIVEKELRKYNALLLKKTGDLCSASASGVLATDRPHAHAHPNSKLPRARVIAHWNAYLVLQQKLSHISHHREKSSQVIRRFTIQYVYD